MPPRKSGISAATLVLSDEFGHMIDMPFLTIHLRSRQGQFSVSASDACASLAFARGTAVMLDVPVMPRHSGNRDEADRRNSSVHGGFSKASVEFLTKIELVINLKAVRALGIDVPSLR